MSGPHLWWKDRFREYRRKGRGVRNEEYAGRKREKPVLACKIEPAQDRTKPTAEMRKSAAETMRF